PAAGRVDRVYPVVAVDARVAGLPFRRGALDGAVLRGDARPELLRGVAAVLRRGGRLVVLAPAPGLSGTLSEMSGIEELAADPRAWVGSSA
ncbi:MAG: hypothetical protein ACODAA_08960, partial [Gemmatimonadota bacterium]